MAQDMKQLVKSRGIIKGQLTRTVKSIKSIDVNNIDVLQHTRERLQNLFARFSDVQHQIELVDETGEHANEAIEVESVYDQCSVFLSKHIRLASTSSASTSSEGHTSPASVASSNNAPSQKPTTPLLPQVKLPEFDGNPDDWHSFRDTFESLVHNNSDLPNVHKFHLLKNALRGKIASIIKSINVTAENYTIAWDQIKKKCEVPRKIIQGHLRSLLDFPSINRNQPGQLSQLVEESEMRVRALQEIANPTQLWDSILIYILTRKLDTETRKGWERTLENSAIPRFIQLSQFLEKQARGDSIEDSARSDKALPLRSEKLKPTKPRVHSYIISQSASPLCPVCNSDHLVHTCPKMLKVSPRERLPIVRTAKLCINCLRPGHTVLQCTASTCKRCGQRHNTLLHFDKAPTQEPEQQSSQEFKSLTAIADPEVLLGTAIIQVTAADGHVLTCRALLDSCSQLNFISKNLTDKLHLPIRDRTVTITGINQTTNHNSQDLDAVITSRCTNFTKNVTFVVLQSISTHVPTRYIKREQLAVPKNITLADPKFHQPGPVDMLIGSKLFYQLLSVGQIRVPSTEILLQKTVLGWIVTGDFDISQSKAPKSCFLSVLDAQLRQFWEQEEVEASNTISTDNIAEKSFRESHTRNSSGRYMVSLPFNKNISALGSSFDTAMQRLISLEKKFAKNESLFNQYYNFLNEYNTLGHMTEIDTSEERFDGYFLPHHAVFKITDGQPKIRVVFDASAASSTGLSLNHCLVVGPTIQQDLFSILARFRTHRYALVADVEKMYRQIEVVPEHRAYQKILWRNKPTDRVRTFALNTVTYGTASAPFLATRCLSQLAHDEGHRFPRAKAALLNDFYVDDLLSGATTQEDAKHLRDELVALTAAGGFNLRQWASNEPSLVNALPEQASPCKIIGDEQQSKRTLGVLWRINSDSIAYTIDNALGSRTGTKRTILSRVAQVFDPLGLVGPVIIIRKCILQELWTSGINWDESPPQSVQTRWQHWSSQLPELNDLNIPRRILIDKPESVELHGFCDASSQAYGACLYVRSSNGTDTAVRLLCAKSRVAPLKTISIPKLELNAAHLLARLFHRITHILNLPIKGYTMWSDSIIVLHWLRKSPHTLKVFVANRVTKIQELTDIAHWRHVNSADNPADIISRGQDARELISNSMWWQGPTWLQQARVEWPSDLLPPLSGELPDQRAIISLPVIICHDYIWSRFSKWTTLVRSIAYCLRWPHFVGNREVRRGPLTTAELSQASVTIVRLVQEETFATELRSLRAGNALDRKSKLLPLNSFIDIDGLIRVGGRLSRADELNINQKHPIVLPKNHTVTDLLIRHNHLTHWHAGPNSTLNAIRQNYWPLGGRNTIRRVLRKCVACFRSKPTELTYKMASLPKARISISRPFSHTGIDYCGPFYIKEKKHRNRSKVKVYVAIFVCFSTKAIHLELVSDLTTEACIASIKRFIGRRGKPNCIYTDNGSNFVGAKNELSQFTENKSTQDHINTQLATQGVEWRLSPPRAPHFGGLWEAAVKSFKTHFFRTVKDTLMTFEGLTTCLIEIEADLNSRPLTPLSSDPNDLSALTPSHFLIGEVLTSLPEHNVTSLPQNRLSAWQHIQRIKQHFWARWHREYLHELQVRSKWHTEDQKKITEGTVVLIREDNLPPLAWKLGRIIDTVPGTDGIVRIARVKTASGTYMRPVKRLCPLPTE